MKVTEWSALGPQEMFILCLSSQTLSLGTLLDREGSETVLTQAILGQPASTNPPAKVSLTQPRAADA